MQPKILRQFLKMEASSGIILFFAAFFAMAAANSPLAFLHQKMIDASLFWINDGLMAVFFLLVGLELKRGYVDGSLRYFKQIVLPLAAAFGGMILPALIYLAFNIDNPVGIKGWAAPVATDIAFALGVLTLFGKKIPSALKLFLLALAIFDDIGAILIIGLFHSSGISPLFILLSAIVLFILFLCNICSITNLALYLLLGVGLWVTMLYAGIHPTLAGVLLAFTIPAEGRNHQPSPLAIIEERLHPWVAFFIMPLFAFVNAGFDLHAVSFDLLRDTVVLGIIFGLFFGKQLGVFIFSWLLIRFRLAKMPDQSSWLLLYGVALLCGIGFTMSLFLGTLSFQHQSNSYVTEVRLGVTIASILSGLTGALVLWFAKDRPPKSKRRSIVD